MGATRLDGGFIDFREIPTPPNPATDFGRLYVKDVASVTTLFFLDSAGTETNLLAAGAGEVNTASNVGGGEGLAIAKVVFDLPFKSLIGGTGITLSSTATEITIDATGGGTGTIRLIKLEGATISTDREGLNFSDTSTINFTVTDDAGNDEADVIAAIVADSVVDVQIGAHTSTKITITAKGQLNSAIVYTDQANAYGDFNQTFRDNRILINSPDETNPITLVNLQQTAGRNLTIPILTGNRTILVSGEGNIVNADVGANEIDETKLDVAVGAASTVLTSNGVGSAPTYQTAAGGEFTGAWTANHNNGGSGFALEDARFADPTDDTKVVRIDAVGMTTGITAILDFNFTTAKTITFPDATTTMVGTGIANQLTNTELTAGVFGKITGLGAQSQTLDMNGNIIDLGSTANVILFGAGESIGMEANDMFFDITAGNGFVIAINGVTEMRFTTTELNLGQGTSGKDIFFSSESEIRWGTADRRIFNNSSGFIFEVETDDTFSYEIDSVEEYSFNATALTMNNNNLILGTGEITVTSGTVGDIFKHDATGFVRFARGTALQVLRVNAGGSDLEYATPTGGGDMVLADPQTVTGAKTFEDGTLLLRNVADTFSGQFTNTITAARVWTLPDAAGTVVITGLANQLTNTELTSGVFAKITGIGVQTQPLDLAAQGITVTSRATGDLLKDNGTNLQRFAIGTANLALHVNAGGTDVEYSILAKAAQVSTTVYTDQSNTFGSFQQVFPEGDLVITDTSGSFGYFFQSGLLTASKAMFLPDLPTNDTIVFAGFANVWGTTDQNIATTGKWQEAGVDISPIGTHDIWVSAGSMWASTTNGPSGPTKVEITSGVDINTFDFDSVTVETAQFEISLPRNYNNLTITYTVWWSSTATDTDGITWGLQAVAIPDGALINTAYGARIDVDDAAQSTASEVLISPESLALTIGDTPADSDLVRFSLSRQVDDPNDTMLEDGRLHGIMIHITTDAATAA